MQDLKSLKEIIDNVSMYYDATDAPPHQVKEIVDSISPLIAELKQLRAEKAASATIKESLTAAAASAKAPLSHNEIEDMAFGYAPSGKIGELMTFAERLLDRAASAKPVEPMPRLPATPEEVVAFIGSHFEVREEEGPMEDRRFTLSVHDLLSAFRDWEPAEQESVAWMRKWHADGEKPYKVKGKWPGKFKFLPVSAGKVFLDDIPLYASPQAPVAAVQWQSMDSAPIDGREVLIRYPKQMNVKQLASFNTIHKHWRSKGEAIFPVQHGAEWIAIPPDA